MTGFEIAIIIWFTSGAIAMIWHAFDDYRRWGDYEISAIDVFMFIIGCIIGGVVFSVWFWGKLNVRWLLETPFLKFKRKGK